MATVTVVSFFLQRLIIDCRFHMVFEAANNFPYLSTTNSLW